MKTFIGAIALIFAAPAFAQAAPAADPHAGHAQHEVAGQQAQQHKDHGKYMEEMHKHCQEAMKHHGKEHGAKSDSSSAAGAGFHRGHRGS